ncbi:phytanoyl-CoA dioxygenase [Penicillium cosmopolitanum]|uniref:Phytanoyl-CoA dioxygenase n=1 Tax=Penicillium cosmopolitanum TaxID=1131564 RepID=A0A9W9W8R5_9EURO|nr:phytanoyl-CoA dioxygenase [Penicillium cosmopolitanum]KAJ5408438.1 phytanoyl-CoA dioxygenase [Penicillium cosmopolitanum]
MKPTSEWTHVPTPAAPIDPSYKPKTSIVTVPATASVDYILGVIARDGGVIISDLVSKDKIATIEEELKARKENQSAQASNDTRSGDAFHIIPSQTTLIPGLVGKSDTVCEICEHPLLDSLRENILLEKYTVYREDWVEPIRIDPLLSLSLSMNIGYGASRQRLHRDDNIHRIRHSGPEDWSFERVSQFGCLIAGCDVTRENGATMFVPGSHKWNDHRMATADEVCFAEMKAGSALIFLGSAFHGGGHNSVPDSIRTMYSLFFVRGIYRTEENQFLTVPRSKLLKMSPKMLQLLGYTKPSMAIGLVDNRSPDEDVDGILQRLIL